MSWERRSLYAGRVGDFGLETGVLPNGVRVTLEILRHVGAAAVVPLHVDGSVTLIRQYRHAGGGMIVEVPAGKLEPGEDPAVCAARELEEEAGVAAEKLTFLLALQTTPAFTDEVIHLYLAEGLRVVGARPESDEVIEVLRVPLEEAIGMIVRGEIRDGKTIAALFLAREVVNKRGCLKPT